MARDGKMVAPAASNPAYPLRSTVNVNWDKMDLSVPAEGDTARVIGIVPDQLVTESLTEKLAIHGGFALSDPERDLLKMAVIERHRASGAVGKGFVKGMGLQEGALASSVAHDHHNIVVIGADDGSMWSAARRVADLGGGMVVANGDHILAEVPLPYAGLMSDQPIDVVRTQLDAAIKAAQDLGSKLHDPFMAMSFLALEVIPHLKLTDKGLVDVDKFELVPLWV